jgi:hypothetical protein
MRGKRTSGRLAPPFFLRGRRGWGDEGQTRTGMQKTAHLSQELYPCEEGGRGDEGGQTRPRTPLPLSALAPPHAGQRDPLDEETL